MYIIQNDHILDELIKYIANYHILYSGQLEICLSVYNKWPLSVCHCPAGTVVVHLPLTMGSLVGTKRWHVRWSCGH